MYETNRHQWFLSGTSVTGSIHERTHKVNQDAIDWSPETGEALPIILALSDGHGSAKYFRSDRGAGFAVSTIIEVLPMLWILCPDFPKSFSNEMKERLCKSIVQTWRSKVEADLSIHPITEEELEKLEKDENSAARRTISNNTILAYGATLVAVIVAEECATDIQLGDGDILIVLQDGTVSTPFAKDERLFANETTSLCSNYAWRDIQMTTQLFSDVLPDLILLSTDGYANSFRTTEEFQRVGSDIVNMVHENGWQEVEDHLKGWLTDATQQGSGDDITVGILYRKQTPDPLLSKESLYEVVEQPETNLIDAPPIVSLSIDEDRTDEAV